MFESVGQIVQSEPGSADYQVRRSDTLSRRTGRKVHRQSRCKGRCESVFWRPMGKADARAIVCAARRYELATRKPGKQCGDLGYVALEIIDLLANLMNKQTGRLDPSITYLMAKLRRSRDAIVRGLQALRRHGFLDWLRRYVPTGNAMGPQVLQTSNAYRLIMPPAAARLLGRYFQPAPVSDDELHRQAEIKAMLDHYIGSLTAAELPLFLLGAHDDPRMRELGKTLASFGATFMKNPQTA